MDRRNCLILGTLLKNGFARRRYSDEQRITMSQSPITQVFWPSVHNNLNKPTGLWYAIGNHWVDWVRFNEPTWEGKYVYLLEVDLSKMVIINTPEDYNNLYKKYGRSRIIGKDFYYRWVDWSAVAMDYFGIEDRGPYCPDFDVISGCIWNPSALISMKQVEGMSLQKNKNKVDNVVRKFRLRPNEYNTNIDV